MYNPKIRQGYYSLPFIIEQPITSNLRQKLYLYFFQP